MSYTPEGIIPPYEGFGDLGGQGVSDLYSLYTEYGYLMGKGIEGFNPGFDMSNYSLDVYDFTDENLLREGFREDYRDFTRGIKGAYAEAGTQRTELEGEMGRSGFAGGGFGSSAMKDFQSDFSTNIKNLKEGMTSTRVDLLDSISGLREDYGEGLRSMYTTWLSADPENLDLIDVTGITECYNQGQIYSHTANDGAGGCIDLGELPDEWDQAFDSPVGGYDDDDGNLITDDNTDDGTDSTNTDDVNPAWNNAFDEPDAECEPSYCSEALNLVWSSTLCMCVDAGGDGDPGVGGTEQGGNWTPPPGWGTGPGANYGIGPEVGQHYCPEGKEPNSYGDCVPIEIF
jgi:hypothetical protein